MVFAVQLNSIIVSCHPTIEYAFVDQLAKSANGEIFLKQLSNNDDDSQLIFRLIEHISKVTGK